MINYQKRYQILTLIESFPTLGARDVFNAVSVFCQVFIVTREKSLSRSFGLRPKGRRCVGLRLTPKIETPLVPRVVLSKPCFSLRFTQYVLVPTPPVALRHNSVNHRHISIYWYPVHSQKIGSLNNDDDDGSEKVAKK